MKTNPRLKMKLITLTLLILLVGVFTQCVPTNTKQIGDNSSSNSYTPPPFGTEDLDEGQTINVTQVSEGIKSHEQILNSMSALTGVSIMNGSVKAVYDQVATSLPTDNDLKVFLPPHQLAITKLAAEFCKVLVDTSTVPRGRLVPLRSVIWRAINFNAIPSVSLSMANRDVIIENVIEAFWGGVITVDEKSMAEQDLHQLIEDLLQGENLIQATTTRNVIKGVCTVVLSSAHVTLL